MKTYWDIAIIDTYDLSAYFFKRMNHFFWRSRKEVYLVIYSSWCVGKYTEPEYAFQEDVVSFILKALEGDSFDERRVIINPDFEYSLILREKLAKWEEEGKVIIAEAPLPPVELLRPPFKLEELLVE